MSLNSFFNRAGSQSRKSRKRERKRLHGACTRIFCFGLVSWNPKTQCFGQPINLVTAASDEDPCADPVSFVRGIQLCNSEVFSFLFFGSERIQISLKAGHDQPASKTSFKWRFAGVPMMTQH